jgi:high-affinity Fe2+/Pb2+ permease
MFVIIIIDLIIALFATAALMTDCNLSRTEFSSASKLASFASLGKWVHCSVIGSFGISAFWLGLTAHLKDNVVDETVSILIAVGLSSLILWNLHHQLWNHERQEAEAAIHDRKIGSV